MTEITLSKLEIEFIRDTMILCLEEMEGIEDSGCDYVCCTGAREQAEGVMELVDNWLLTINNPEEDLDE
jgi:hypothetical protein